MTKRIDLQHAGTDALLAEYADAALAHRHASREGKYNVANRAHERLSSVVRELRSREPDGLFALTRLFADERIEVRGWAAAHGLEFAPEQASKVLEDVASGPSSLAEFSAKMVLLQWRQGTLRTP
jgi:hypothetical protein